MLRVKVDLVPFGIEDASREILCTTIGNIGSNEAGNYNYSYAITGAPWRGVKPNEEGFVFNYDRDKPLVNLLAEVFSSAVEPESIEAVNMFRFARTLNARYEELKASGKSGWEGCDIEYLWELLDKNAQQLDPIDVGVLAWMIYERTK